MIMLNCKDFGSFFIEKQQLKISSFETVFPCQQPFYSILLSRQARRPQHQDWWLHATNAVCKWAGSKKMTAIVGGGLIQLDFARWCAHSFGKVIFVDITCAGGRKNSSPTCADKWFDKRIELSPNSKMTLQELYLARDKVIADLSDIIIGIAVRKGGVMEQIGKQAIRNGKRVIVLAPPIRKRCYEGNFALLDAGAEILEIPVCAPETGKKNVFFPQSQGKILNEKLNGWLWHYTREHIGPWHEQSWDSYFEGLILGAPDSSHSAFDSLMKIIEEERIRSSGKLIKGGEPVVCWTSTSPFKILSRRSYRKALARWEFHPYAVAVKLSMGEKLGIKPVICVSSYNYKSIHHDQRYLYKRLATNGKNKWAELDEWRYRGDFLLTDILPSDGLVLVNNFDEKKIISAKSRFPVLSIEEITDS